MIQEVFFSDFVLSYGLFRERFGPGAVIAGMRDLLDLTTDTPQSAASRQMWITYATLTELELLKQIDSRLADVECAAREMALAEESGNTEAVRRDFFAFVDDKSFGLCVALPRALDPGVGKQLYAGAAHELQRVDLYAIDVSTQRRFAVRFSDFEILEKK